MDREQDGGRSADDRGAGEDEPGPLRRTGESGNAAKHFMREHRHHGLSISRLTADEVRWLIDRLFGIRDKEELLSSLRKLYGSTHLTKDATNRLLALFDGQGDKELQDAILEVLLYSVDEEYAVDQVAKRLAGQPISDARYGILGAFPASRQVLDFLVQRFAVMRVESRAAVDCIQTTLFSSGVRDTPAAEKLAQMLQTQVTQAELPDMRASLIYLFVSTATESLPAQFEQWWAQETSELVKLRALDAFDKVGLAGRGWARAFLARIIAAGLPPDQMKAAKDSLRRLTPIYRGD